MYYKQQQAKLKYEASIFETKDGKQFIVLEERAYAITLSLIYYEPNY